MQYEWHVCQSQNAALSTNMRSEVHNYTIYTMFLLRCGSAALLRWAGDLAHSHVAFQIMYRPPASICSGR